MVVIEAFSNLFEDEHVEDSWFQSNKFMLLLLLIKLVFIYIVMLLWPRVMPKLFPGIVKQPTYINLIGLSVILSLI